MQLDYLVLDIEASKKPRFKPWVDGSFLSSIGVSNEDKYSSWFFNPEIGDSSQHIKDIQTFFDNTDMLVCHNAKFDMLWLIHCGFNLPKKVWCTQIAEYLLKGQERGERGELSLNEVASKYGFGTKVDEMKWYWENGYETDEIPIDVHKEYLKQDVLLTQQVYLKQREMIEEAGLLSLMELTTELTMILAMMEYNGTPIDMNIANKIHEDAQADVAKLIEELKRISEVDFNPASSKQLASVLFGGELVRDGIEYYERTLKSGAVVQKSRKAKIKEDIKGLGFVCNESNMSKVTGAPSTGKDSIGSLVATTDKQKEFLDALTEYKKINKMISTLISSDGSSGWLVMASNDRLHGEFNQTITVTGRLSSTNPNMQNIARGGTSPLKSCIKPKDKDWLIVNLDLAQIEWRMAAELCQDPIMIQEIIDGIDIHSANACAFFGVNMEDKDSSDEAKAKAFKKARQASKTLGFRLLYGGGPYGFFLDKNMPDLPLEKWKQIIEQFYNKYSKLKEWQEKNYKEVLTNGYMRTISNRVLAFTKVNFSDEDRRKKLKRDCSNYPVQSASADLFNSSIVETFKSKEFKESRANMLMFVHDSIVMEIHKDDVSKVVKKVLSIFKDLPNIFEKRFGYKCVVPLFGEAEVGYDYRELTACDENSVDSVVASLV